MQKYSVHQHSTETILAWIRSGEIAIPEIQRPFVWNSIKVRDLMDSLYHGYPIGYLIIWRNPDVRLKNGKTADGKKILIDGQQRVIALKAAILGEYVINKKYRRIRIKIAFNPLQERFEVLNPAIERDVQWIPDISQIFGGNVGVLELIDDYCSKNPEVNKNIFYNKIEPLLNITKKQIGVIELEHELDIETVTEIFIRINRQGAVLSQADFVMSKIAANESYGGSTLRKCIDYFCHLAVAPEFYSHIIDSDEKFAKTEYFKKMSWLKNEKDDLYDPRYTDLLRVVFTSEFHRGKLSDLVSLLSGRNFEMRTYEEEIAQQSFGILEKGILNFINETNFKQFVMIIKSAGFVSADIIHSQNALNFAYIVYLKLRSCHYNPAEIEKYVRKWFVLSLLTGRYSTSLETRFDDDIKNISNKDFEEYLQNVEEAELSDAFWEVGLIQSLDSSAPNSPYFSVFLASQVKANDRGFLSKDITIRDLIMHKGDRHHIFPREYLKKNGMKQGQYNQIANYVYMQSDINIRIGDSPPNMYFRELREQCSEGALQYGGITDPQALKENLLMNSVPEDIFSMDISDYEDFLMKRRVLMSKKIREYYFSL